MRRTLLLAVFLALGFAAPAQAVLVYERDSDIVVAGDDGSDPRVVARGTLPVVAPNGRKVAYFGVRDRRPSGKLHLVATRGGRARVIARRVYSPQLRALAFAWSPDSRYVALPSRAGIGAAIVDVRRGTQVRVRFDCPAGDAAFSPGSRRVVVANGCTRDSALGIAHVDGSHKRTVARNGLAPAWGAGGLAYTKMFRGCAGCEPNGTLVLAARPGAPPRALLKHQDPIVLPIGWSADGRRLLAAHYTGRTRTEAQPVLISPKSGQTRKLAPAMSEIAMIARDGSAVLGVLDGNVVSVAASDGEPTLLATGAASPSWTR
jgi:hypothetical protein